MRLLRSLFRITNDRRLRATNDRQVRTANGRRRSPNEGWYRSGACRPLTACQIRERRFRSVRRDGLDPLEVYAFLHRVAGELAVARRELAYTVEENVRIKRALRSWQSRFAPRLHR
ncbi:DivIVA domain-containing protein [Micromonospora cathayae]|uniref:DivIVA domain-containing protein n=1 Tax=Micromonospora cathayae TaxID=3028804 RepID=A0ABY7ZSI1_9ACTN|nr:DivIVA domain-containing protein [Micromonospora sp. HUAS 3]WDZ85443.1 DivIVA domain-containing protein [Micromonospora sp. HUAS 3]